jgi:DNA gyrase subunit B
VSQWSDKLADTLVQPGDNGHSYIRVDTQFDAEQSVYLPVVTVVAHGNEKPYPFNKDFFKSGEYQQIVELGESLIGLIEPGGYIQRGERQQEIENIEEALDWLMAQAKRGQYIQRYKGLGEMNPEQLWETTMDPDSRRMLQVSIEDAITADQMFTTLMGDAVEPRRDFIEDNALSVANLDV